jgi:hypothetical protein
MIYAERTSHRNQNARITTEVIAPDGKSLITPERKMNTETGYHKKDDDGRRSEDNRLPSVSNKPSKLRSRVHTGKDGQYLVVANCDPKSQNKP